MKALVLAGGKGTRLRPITYTSAKQLIPVANKPILAYGLEAIVKAGITEIGLIVGDPTATDIQSAMGDGSSFGAKFTYIKQDAPLGLAHAVWTAKDFLKDDSFLMFLGDNLIHDPLGPLVEQFEREKPDALLLLAQVADPRAFGVVEIQDERIVRLVEKPKDPPSNLALVGVYLFNRNIFDAIKTLKPSWRGELEITEAIQNLLSAGKVIRYRKITGWWKDTGKKEDLLEASRFILQDMVGERVDGTMTDTEVDGPIRVGRGTVITKSKLHGPLIIGDGCTIENAQIGPFTSLADAVTVKDTKIDHSILFKEVVVVSGGHLTQSLIGQGVRVSRDPETGHAISLCVGDHAEVIL